MASSSTPMCAVCNASASRYRCPLCKARYCSVTCFGRHKGSADCVVAPPLDSASDARPDAAAALVANRKRGTAVREDDVLYKVTPDALSKVAKLDRVRDVMAEVQRRKRGYAIKPASAINDNGDDDDDVANDAAPDVLGTVNASTLAEAERASVVRGLADVVEAIARHKYLDDQRKALLLYMANDESVAAFADELLRAVGARDDEGHFIL